MKKILYLLTVTSLILFACVQNVYAASYSVSVSSSTVEPYGTVTVTVNASGCEGSFYVSATSGASVTGNTLIWSGESTTVKASSSSFTITVTPQSVADSNNGTNITSKLSAKSQTITVRQATQSGGGNSSSINNSSSSNSNNNYTQNYPQGSSDSSSTEPAKSNDASLASLQISDGTLSPAFKSGTTNYELSLPSDAESIKIEAKANDSKASVSGAGEISLKQGNNKIEIIVTAEDGTTKTYTINAYVEEKPEVYLNYHDQELGIVKNTDQVSKPSDAFEETTLEIDGKEVTGWTNNIMDVTVLYMIDEESGEKNFYIYDTESKSITSIFKPVALLGNNLYIIDIDEDLQDRIGMTFTTVTVDEQELPGWTFDEAGFDSYCLIYVMNEQGEKQYYQYEATQNTLQLYSNAAPISTESYEKSQQVEKIAIILAGVFGVTTIAALIGCVVIRRRSNLRVRRLVKKENLFEE